MKIGINTFLFASPFTNEQVKWFPIFKQWGFDFIEIALEDPSNIDPVYIRKQLDRYQLPCSAICAAMGPGRDLRGTGQEQESSLQYLKSLMDVMGTLGCSLLAGPMYSSVGRAEEVSETDYQIQWQMVVQHLKTLARYAAERNIKLAIEPLNRFETDFINTCAQGLQMVKEVGHPALSLHLDTFHMNIEEKNLKKAILNTGKHIGHIHISGSDRGTPGNDHIDWEGIFSALRQIDYQGNIAIESFTKDVKVIAKAAAIWRLIEPSREEIAIKGLQFLRSHLNQGPTVGI
jgi:D-psicose/D-tagatose/L-ribulose 3-epimerase